MNNNCTYLKQKINRTLVCKKQKKIINIRECNNCNLKEYKKCIEFSKNNTKKTICHTSKKLRQKTAKLSMLERNRYSVFTDNRDKCMFCPNIKNLTWHECFAGSNRQKSMQYGFCLRICISCHQKFQENKQFNDYWHNRCREYWIKHYGTLEEFIKEFGKSYLIKK